jgi:hypothetical protein
MWKQGEGIVGEKVVSRGMGLDGALSATECSPVKNINICRERKRNGGFQEQ